MCSFPLLKMCQRSKTIRLQAKESQSLRALVISHRYERAKVALNIAEVNCFENALRTRRLIYPNFFFEVIMFPRSIAGFHCHAIKIKIENHSLNEVKKLTRKRP